MRQKLNNTKNLPFLAYRRWYTVVLSCPLGGSPAWRLIRVLLVRAGLPSEDLKRFNGAPTPLGHIFWIRTCNFLLLSHSSWNIALFILESQNKNAIQKTYWKRFHSLPTLVKTSATCSKGPDLSCCKDSPVLWRGISRSVGVCTPSTYNHLYNFWNFCLNTLHFVQCFWCFNLVRLKSCLYTCSINSKLIAHSTPFRLSLHHLGTYTIALLFGKVHAIIQTTYTTALLFGKVHTFIHTVPW